MKDVFEKKSQFWKGLPSTPGSSVVNEWGATKFQCSNKNEVQVFNIAQNQRWLFASKKRWGYVFADNCGDKTILINFQGAGTIKVNAVDLIYKDKKGYGPDGFPTCMTSSILWNFPDAVNVEIGNGKTSEFQ